MALDIEIIQHDAFLEAVVTGSYNLQDAIDRFPHILSGLSKVLIDFRKLTGIPATTEKIIYAFGIQDHYNSHISTGGQELMVAFVGSAPFVTTYEPELKIAKDSNMPFDLFTDIAEAHKWLGVQPT